MQLCRRCMASWWTLCNRAWRPSPLRCQTWPAWHAAPHGCNPSPCRHATLHNSLFSETTRPKHCQSMACQRPAFATALCLYESGRLGRKNITQSMLAFMHVQSPRVSLPCSYAGKCSGAGPVGAYAPFVQAHGEALRLALVWLARATGRRLPGCSPSAQILKGLH